MHKSGESAPTGGSPTLKVARSRSESRTEAMARAALRPTVQAALTVMDYDRAFGELSVNALVADLGRQCERVRGGDLARAEELLMAQAHTLDAIFHRLARKASGMGRLNQFEVHLRLALKAQSQCRATLETLAAIRNPQSLAFVRQANIAHGPQQVNNAVTPPSEPPPETEKPQNELLEEPDGQWLDPGPPGATGRTDPGLETVAAVDRPANLERQEARLPQCLEGQPEGMPARAVAAAQKAGTATADAGSSRAEFFQKSCP